MKRRDALIQTTWIVQSAIFGPSLMGAISGCRSEIADNPTLSVLDGQQYDLTIAIADTILPRTDTPSASEVKVPQFLDLLLRDTFDQATREAFTDGLNLFDENCKTATGKTFTGLEQTDRHEYLLKVDQRVMGKGYAEEVPFYYAFKKLAITIYYSTERAVKQNLDYRPVPGPFQGDMRVEPGQKIMVGNDM